jgi:hypothetical protein
LGRGPALSLTRPICLAYFSPCARPTPLHFSRFCILPRGPVAKSWPSKQPMNSAIFFQSKEQSNMKKLFPNQNLCKIGSKRNSCSNPACTRDRGQRWHEISMKTPIKRSPQSSDFEENLAEILAPPKVTARLDTLPLLPNQLPLELLQGPPHS